MKSRYYPILRVDTQNMTRGRRCQVSRLCSGVSGHMTTCLVTTHLRLLSPALHWPGLAASRVCSESPSLSVCTAHASTPHRRGRSLRLSQSGKLCGWVLLVLFIFTLRWFSLVTKSRQVFDEFQNVNNIKLCLTK